MRYANLTEYLRKGWPVFAPFNCVLYLLTSRCARAAVMDIADYPELIELENHWEEIRDEANLLYESGYFEKTVESGAASSYDLGFRTFFKYGWSKFYLRWYGYTHQSALDLCPKTISILKNIPSINGAMFSILGPTGRLTRHLDPFACSLRCHLGLITPNSDSCYINVDGETLSWRDGKAIVFDQTYLHYVENETNNYRIILMLDVERPMLYGGRLFNTVYKWLSCLTVVPNLSGDKIGILSRIFRKVSPIMEKGKLLKKTNRRRYYFIKYLINISLITLLFCVIFSFTRAVSILSSSIF